MPSAANHRVVPRQERTETAGSTASAFARCEHFSKFYHTLVQEPYPPQAGLQCLPFLFEEAGIQLLALNSAWEIDEYHKDRPGIHESTLAAGLFRAGEQIKDAKAHERLAQDAPILRIGVWPDKADRHRRRTYYDIELTR